MDLISRHIISIYYKYNTFYNHAINEVFSMDTEINKKIIDDIFTSLSNELLDKKYDILCKIFILPNFNLELFLYTINKYEINVENNLDDLLLKSISEYNDFFKFNYLLDKGANIQIIVDHINRDNTIVLPFDIFLLIIKNDYTLNINYVQNQIYNYLYTAIYNLEINKFMETLDILINKGYDINQLLEKVTVNSHIYHGILQKIIIKYYDFFTIEFLEDIYYIFCDNIKFHDDSDTDYENDRIDFDLFKRILERSQDENKIGKIIELFTIKCINGHNQDLVNEIIKMNIPFNDKMVRKLFRNEKLLKNYITNGGNMELIKTILSENIKNGKMIKCNILHLLRNYGVDLNNLFDNVV